MSPEALRVAVQAVKAEADSAGEWARQAEDNVEAAQAALELALSLRQQAQERLGLVIEAWRDLAGQEMNPEAQAPDSGVVIEE